MIILLSPAKTLDFNCKVPTNITLTKPCFAAEAWQLIEILKKHSSQDLEKLMDISPKLAELNYQRFQEFSQDYQNRLIAEPCIYVYNGDVYDGIDIENYTESQLDFANKNLRIISGLYGILKPFDLIQAYRLEMSTNLTNSKGKTLYAFWDDKITKKLNEEEGNTIINLASQEYSSAIIPQKCAKTIINIQFKENIKGIYKIIGIHSKKARGIMANYIITNLIQSPEDVKDFNLAGYKYCSKTSNKNEFIFVRD